MQNLKRWSLICLKHTSHIVAQCFAFIACQFDDLSKFAEAKIREE